MHGLRRDKHVHVDGAHATIQRVDLDWRGGQSLLQRHLVRVDQVVVASHKLVGILINGIGDLHELHLEVARLMHVLLVALLAESQHGAGAGARLQLDHRFVLSLCDRSSVRMNFTIAIFNCLEAATVKFLERAAELNLDVRRGSRRRLVLSLVAVAKQTTVDVSAFDFEVAG